MALLTPVSSLYQIMNKCHVQREHGVDDARCALYEIQSLVQDCRKRRDTSLKQTLRCPIQGPERDLPKIKAVLFVRVYIDCLRFPMGQHFLCIHLDWSSIERQLVVRAGLRFQHPKRGSYTRKPMLHLNRI